ncbi:hypothetical protein LCGC14_2318280 [marine sediment metagenome]|uniref:Uncharacterized protein n=1 Tax=marine sediment metagenome TaxID=412755 RepID=A0A0F9D628_9ZZZZ
MRQSHSQRDPAPGTGQEDPAPLITLPLDLTDHAGRKRQGRAVLLSRWLEGTGGEDAAKDEDFRIVLLSEPPEGLVSPAEGMVVSAPAGRLAFGANAVGEVAATYTAGSDPAWRSLPRTWSCCGRAVSSPPHRSS